MPYFATRYTKRKISPFQDASKSFFTVAGVNVNLSMGITIGLCTFYTALVSHLSLPILAQRIVFVTKKQTKNKQGGIKAVVWTDTLQVSVMFGSVGALIVKGVIDVGDFNTVWLRNDNTSRIEFFK